MFTTMLNKIHAFQSQPNEIWCLQIKLSAVSIVSLFLAGNIIKIQFFIKRWRASAEACFLTYKKHAVLGLRALCKSSQFMDLIGLFTQNCGYGLHLSIKLSDIILHKSGSLFYKDTANATASFWALGRSNMEYQLPANFWSLILII